MDKSLLDYEVSVDTDCKLLTVGKPFAIEGERPPGPVFPRQRGGWGRTEGKAPLGLPLAPARPLASPRLWHWTPPELSAHLQPVRIHQPLQVLRLH